MKSITENIIEELAIEILQSRGWVYKNGKERSPLGGGVTLEIVNLKE